MITGLGSSISSVITFEKPLERLSTADPSKVQEIAASQIELLNGYYGLALNQAQRSFLSAIITAVAGFGLFVAAIVIVLLFQQSQIVSIISAISGAIIEVIAGLNFHLYGKTTAQLSNFLSRLDTTQRFLLANSVCEGLEGDVKQQVRADLVRAIARINGKSGDSASG
jgi:hypothetical protein